MFDNMAVLQLPVNPLDEEQLKLRQKELAEEIELDIHRQNLLEQSGTINKLKTQLDLFRNKIMEEEIAPNNYKL